MCKLTSIDKLAVFACPSVKVDSKCELMCMEEEDEKMSESGVRATADLKPRFSA